MFYNTETCALEMSVRELCERAHKSGNLDARNPRRSLSVGARLPETDPFAEDWRIEGEHTEVLLCNTTTFRGIAVTVQGVADKVIRCGKDFVVEEIKIAQNGRYPQGRDAFSRLRCYAYFLAAAQQLTFVTLRTRVVYKDGRDDEIIDKRMDKAELYSFYQGLLERVWSFVQWEILRRTELIPSVEGIAFPYKMPREGQTELAQATFRAIRKGRRLVAHAPTGIGKTMSTLYPSVKALGSGFCERIFYLTAKQNVRREAYAAAGKLFECGARIRTIILYAKEQMCLRDGGCKEGCASACNPISCPYARGYYDRCDGAILELLSRQNGFPRSILQDVARAHRICPYELSLDLSEQCEIIICDYNYVFDPAVSLRRYFDENGERGKYVFLIDEAHNLPDRVRDMFSCRLDATNFERVYARVNADADPRLEVLLGGFVMTLHRLSSLCRENAKKTEDGTKNGYYLSREPLRKFWEEAEKFKQGIEGFLRSFPDHSLALPLQELLSDVKKYLLLGCYYDERFLTYVQLLRGKITTEIYCLDPSGVIGTSLGRAVSSVLFSATLTPLDYFSDLCGCGKSADMLQLLSPYDPKNLCLTVMPSIDTSMEERAKSYKRVATMIAAAVSAKPGNYIVYFPSYDYMQHVQERFAQKYPSVSCILQKRSMNPHERDAFLDFFKNDEGKLRIAFCVLGGGFSEGVDLPGDRLIGVIVVGVGMPGISNERNFLRDYFENKCERGFDYAYTYPGMNRVLQAAGRVIRSETDRGIVVLIDRRYATEPYMRLFPPHWEDVVAAGDAGSLAARVERFWAGE